MSRVSRTGLMIATGSFNVPVIIKEVEVLSQVQGHAGEAK